MKIVRTCLLLSLGSIAFSCSDFKISLPQGPNGDDGQSSYYLWKTEVEAGNVAWPSDRTELSDFIAYKKGDKGDAGDSAYELWKQLIASGNVPDPHDPSGRWDPAMNSEVDFWNYLTGRDGQAPHVGANGNWWIGSEDTRVAAIGKDGKDGNNGLDGLDGESAYSLWKKLVNDGTVDWPKDQTTETDFYTYLKGKDGANGVVPHVGTNGNWYIGGTDTGVPAKGEKGDTGDAGANGTVPYIGANGNWFIGTDDTGIASKGDEGDAGADGADGIVPHIGANGNWFIGTTDTGKPAKGETGDTGASGADGTAPHIGANGHWWVGTVDTGIVAKGNKGDKGDNGDNGADGAMPVIIDGIWWIGSTNTGIAAKGATGDKGATGADGVDGADGKIPYIQDGHWFIGTTDTGITAKGEQGDAGADGVDGADGADGTVPHIGTNGNWFIGTTDTGIAAAGKDGAAGKSAYELWIEDVKAGRINDKSGNKWSADKITIEDFYSFLKGEDGADGADGADGKNGSSAYEMWKELAAKGTLDDPKNPGQKWPASNVTEADFYYYLSGEDGADGIASSVNGKSAWELWKEELAARAGTGDPLWNYAEDVEWDPAKNSLEDFYLYLRGTDGANGKDGKPGLPGEPGAIVTIVKGQPNVIAQYSQSEFGEYVRTSDGGVLYKVYDKFGAPAPGAVVKGLPGLDPSKTYTANSNGEFIIPRTDLPEIQEIDARWGTVAEVTIKGETLESAQNTYVPNQPHIRIILKSGAENYMSNYTATYFVIQRKMNPDDEWENLVNYLPNYNSFNLTALKLTDRNDPNSIDNSVKIYSTSGSGNDAALPGEKYQKGYLYAYTYRFIVDNIAENQNYNSAYGDGEEVFFTIKATTNYYGMPIKWNGVAMLPPYQIAPLPKKLHFFNISSTEEPYFRRCDGEYDESTFDISKVYKSTSISVYNPDGIESVSYEKYTIAEAKNLKPFYLSFQYSSKLGSQNANNSVNKCSMNSPGFTILTPYYGAKVYSYVSSVSVAAGYPIGDLLRKANGEYYIRPFKSGVTYPNLTVTYSVE